MLGHRALGEAALCELPGTIAIVAVFIAACSSFQPGMIQIGSFQPGVMDAASFQTGPTEVESG